MKLRLFKKKPAARIKLGNTFLGEKISATAEGYVIYKEWDTEDKVNYYWEEWELRGFNDYDSFIEYDHYTRTITLYEPLKPMELIDLKSLRNGQTIAFTTRRGEKHTAKITEIGTGIVARREGKFTYDIFEGDKVMYAECRDMHGAEYSIESYNDKEFDIYKATTLNRTAQKKTLGRVVAPGLLGIIRSIPLHNRIIILVVAFFIIVPTISGAVPRYSTFCTPRVIPRPQPVQGFTSSPTPSSSTSQTVTAGDELVSEDSTQSCYRRRIYSAAGSGAGK